MGDKSFWRHVWDAFWRPMEFADKALILFGGILAFSARYNPGAEDIMLNLAWQIPLGALVIFTLGRILFAPYKVYKELQNERKAIRENPKESGKEEISTQESSTDCGQKCADWMTAALNRDNRNFKACLSFDLNPQQIDWSHLGAPDSYAIFPFWVYSKSVYSVTIEEVESGRVLVDDLEPKDKPEITSKLDGLTRTDFSRLIIRVDFSDSLMQKLVFKMGTDVDLNFGRVIVKVLTKLPDGSAGPVFPINLDWTKRIRIPTRAEIEH